ncbi:hypothetical protein [Thalassobaculum sp.]|uniref:hypothetical protein n=1 Tax=Thalassobaculum sp. TaxID=2022740 RepID=UPI0032EB19A5
MIIKYFNREIELSGTIAIQNYLSSGTMLLGSLFDSHPSILTLPGLYSRLLYRNFYSSIKDGKMNPSNFVDQFPQLNIEINDRSIQQNSLDRLGPNRSQRIGVNKSEFARNYAHLMKENFSNLNRKWAILLLCLAYKYTANQKINNTLFFIWDIHSSSVVERQYFQDDFPDSKIIHMIRRPEALFDSGIRHVFPELIAPRRQLSAQRRRSRPGVERVLGQLFEDCLWTSDYNDGPQHLCADVAISEFKRDDSRSIYLEDLHAHGEAVMRAVCAWTGLPWHNCLLESTFDGKQWWNRPGSSLMSGLQKAQPTSQIPGFMWRFDVARVRAIAHLKAADYREIAWPSMWIRSGFLAFLTFLIPLKAEFWQPINNQEIIADINSLGFDLSDQEKIYVVNRVCELTRRRRNGFWLLKHWRVRLVEEALNPGIGWKRRWSVRPSHFTMAYAPVGRSDRPERQVLILADDYGYDTAIPLLRRRVLDLAIRSVLAFNHVIAYLSVRASLWRSRRHAASMRGQVVAPLAFPRE